MQTPVAIEYQDGAIRPDLRQAVETQVEKLQKYFGEITSCRVVVKGPGGHHHNGGLHEINIRLALPDGREVNVGRVDHGDERHADLAFAVNDAFKRARRQLQDQVERLRREIKPHALP